MAENELHDNMNVQVEVGDYLYRTKHEARASTEEDVSTDLASDLNDIRYQALIVLWIDRDNCVHFLRPIPDLYPVHKEPPEIILSEYGLPLRVIREPYFKVLQEKKLQK